MAVKKGKRLHGVNPLKLDPTRTSGLRAAFTKELMWRFEELKRRVRKLIVEEDALGLKESSHDPFLTTPISVLPESVTNRWTPVENVFCPTGTGGGIDPTCGNDSTSTKSLDSTTVADHIRELRNDPANNTEEVVQDAANKLAQLTGAAIAKIKKDLGVKASGKNKKDLARKIMERALTSSVPERSAPIIKLYREALDSNKAMSEAAHAVYSMSRSQLMDLALDAGFYLDPHKALFDTDPKNTLQEMRKRADREMDRIYTQPTKFKVLDQGDIATVQPTDGVIGWAIQHGLLEPEEDSEEVRDRKAKLDSMTSPRRFLYGIQWALKEEKEHIGNALKLIRDLLKRSSLDNLRALRELVKGGAPLVTNTAESVRDQLDALLRDLIAERTAEEASKAEDLEEIVESLLPDTNWIPAEEDRWLPVYNEGDNCGTGAGGFQPGNTCAKGGKKIPNPAGVSVLSDLPGSTGPQLVVDAKGTKWQMKKGKTADHSKNEQIADDIYRVLGIRVRHSGLSEDDPQYKFNEWLPEGKTLAELSHTSSYAEIVNQIREGFVADALLANWDVIGLSKDNIFVTPDGKVHRIDNGGALKYRAQGSPKGSKFGPTVGEIDTLRNPSMNPSAASIYKGITDSEIKKQIEEILPKRKEVLDVVTDPETKKILNQRFDDLKNRLDTMKAQKTDWKAVAEQALAKVKTSSATVDAVYPQEAKPVSSNPLHSGNGLAEYIQNSLGKKGLKITSIQFSKIKALNPQGLSSGKVYYPTGSFTKPEAKQALIAMFPAGTKIYSKDITIAQTVTKLGTLDGSKTTITSTDTEPKSPVASGESIHVNPTLAKYPQSHLDWVKTLTSVEEAAISEWKEFPFSIRKSISSGNPTPSAEHFMTAITRQPPVAGVFYRGVHNKGLSKYASEQMAQIEAAGVGGEWSDDAPHGMSPNPKIGVGFSGGELLLRVKSKNTRPIHKAAGSFTSSGPGTEMETIGMPGTTYKIVGIHKNSKLTSDHPLTYTEVKMLVDLEEI